MREAQIVQTWFGPAVLQVRVGSMWSNVAPFASARHAQRYMLVEFCDVEKVTIRLPGKHPKVLRIRRGRR